MLVSPFSCTRPEPDHVAAARAFASAAELDAAIAAGDYTCDVSRALYLVAHAANGAVTTAVACCCDLSELGGSVACGQALRTRPSGWRPTSRRWGRTMCPSPSPTPRTWRSPRSWGRAHLDPALQPAARR